MLRAPMARGKPMIWFGTLLVLAGAGFSVWRWRAEEAEVQARVEREQRLEERREERQQEREEFVDELRAESAELMPAMLEGVALGMDEAELRQLRRAVRPNPQGNDPRLSFLSERLSNGAQIMYGFTRGSGRLVRIQVMSMLPGPEAVGPHLTAMLETYGRPTGAYNCPDTGGVPTRRFTWRRAHTALADIFLVYGERVSVTLDIAPAETIGASLRRSSCQPITREQLGEFPAATVDQVLAAQEEQGG